MKALRTEVLFDRSNIMESVDWQVVHESYLRAIHAIDFPRRSGALTLRAKERDPTGRWRRNGVNYLRACFLEEMTVREGWESEGDVVIPDGSGRQPVVLYPTLESFVEPTTSAFGEFDFVTTAPNGTRVAIEWETGNVSSSHRSMNKLALALGSGVIDAGVLVVPSRHLYQHLTDRIGNIGELAGYFPLWQNLPIARGLLAVTVVEHDHLTRDPGHPYLGTSITGRARKPETV